MSTNIRDEMSINIQFAMDMICIEKSNDELFDLVNQITTDSKKLIIEKMSQLTGDSCEINQKIVDEMNNYIDNLTDNLTDNVNIESDKYDSSDSLDNSTDSMDSAEQIQYNQIFVLQAFVQLGLYEKIRSYVDLLIENNIINKDEGDYVWATYYNS